MVEAKYFHYAIFLPKMSLYLYLVMAKNYFKSYVWLLDTLQSRGPLTLNQIKKLWSRSSINEDKKELATRTFSNHITAIADIFGIDIVCDRRDNTYRIANDGELGGSGLRNWMMEALCLNNLANESAGLRKRISFENGPSCHRFLTEIIRAVRDERMLEVNYKSFSMDAPRDFLLEPFCLKEYKSRWYLFARDHNGKYKEPHSFALDRMNSVVVSEKSFIVPETFDMQDFFGARYGVLHYEGEEPACVKLKVCARQAEYFRTLPLHASQNEEERNAEYSIFNYHLTPNYDFIHDILYYADDVEVLEPVKLRDSIIQLLERTITKYN